MEIVYHKYKGKIDKSPRKIFGGRAYHMRQESEIDK